MLPLSVTNSKNNYALFLYKNKEATTFSAFPFTPREQSSFDSFEKKHKQKQSVELKNEKALIFKTIFYGLIATAAWLFVVIRFGSKNK